ncbi:ferritin family protein [Chitinispirillales bacterium ANBcel5]|uniref:ferritin family protein n=1 Tax=Cellulosispirillum alkaliphilum TaxID=3039283 RepID=UPI002A52CF8C|nr:ferritin family protein [Chitinispirillales bacterium ANBcel5]
MAEFVNPFSGVVPGKKISERELSRAIRLSLAAEEEAIHLYEALADATDNKLAKAVLQDVANEERVHAGEFQKLLELLLPDEKKLMQEGAEEVEEMLEEGAAQQKEIKTVGNLKD